MRRLIPWMVCAALAAALPAYAGAPMQVAITFDDLPSHASLPPGVSRTDIAKSVIRTLKAHHAPPVYGFVNATWLTREPGSEKVLQLWRAAGYPLGNHTFSHIDSDTSTVAAFEQEVLADEPVLQKYMKGRDWHYLRFPYLHAGDTPEKRRQIQDFAKGRGYRPALVTLSFDDYAFNDPYARCSAKGDKEAIDGMKQTFLDRASVDLMRGKAMSEAVYGRNIKHVLLMHIGAFDAAMLPSLLDMYRQRGVKLISLPEAERDPAYRNVAWGGIVLEDEMEKRNLPLPQGNPESDLKRLATLCE